MSEAEQCEDAFFVAYSRLLGVLYEHCQEHACLREQHVATRTLLRQTPLQHTCYALHAAPRINYIAWPTSAALAPSPFICVVRIVRYQVVYFGRQPVFRIAQPHQDRTIDQSPFAAWSVCALRSSRGFALLSLYTVVTVVYHSSLIHLSWLLVRPGSCSCRASALGPSSRGRCRMTARLAISNRAVTLVDHASFDLS